jgi:hypothetical protein
MIITLNSGFIEGSRAKTKMIRFVTESKGFVALSKPISTYSFKKGVNAENQNDQLQNFV